MANVNTKYQVLSLCIENEDGTIEHIACGDGSQLNQTKTEEALLTYKVVGNSGRFRLIKGQEYIDLRSGQLAVIL